MLTDDNVMEDWPSFREKLASPELQCCSDAAEVCAVVSRDYFYARMCPGIQQLSTIALCLPMSTAWPERGFSTLKRVKSKYRNRLLDPTLSALLNITLNGACTLTDQAAEEIAAKWFDRRKRRVVTQRAVDSVVNSPLMEEELKDMYDDFDDELFRL